MTQDMWMTRSEVSAYLRISLKTLDRWRADGLITTYPAPKGRGVRFRRSEIEALMEVGQRRPEEPALAVA